MPLRTRILLTLTAAMTVVASAVFIFDHLFHGNPFWRIAGIIFVISGFAFFSNRLFENWITEPLSKFSAAAHALKSGKYSTEILNLVTQRKDDVGEFAAIFDKMARSVAERDQRLQLLKIIIPMGVRLSAEKDFDRLLEMMVIEAQKITNADGGTLYLRDGDKLRFVVLRNNSLGIEMGGRTGKAITFQPLNLHNEAGEENVANVAAYVALKGKRVHLEDAYDADGFDFSGTRKFDRNTGYRSKSFLTFPLEGDEGRVIGVLQLINAINPLSGEIVPFSSDEVIEGLSLLTSAALAGYIRAEALRQEIDKLRIEIDVKKRDVQVAEITDTTYFKDLHAKARQVRAQKRKKE